jgi:GTP-binding protein HflX
VTRNISGNLTGLKPSELQNLERLGRRRVPPSAIVNVELATSMAAISRELGRQLGLLVSREGHIEYIAVGDASKIHLPDFGRLRASAGRFRGLRLIHTHLHDEALTRDDLVDLVRLRFDLVAAVCVSPMGGPTQVYYAHLLPGREGDDPWRTEGPISIHKLDVDFGELIRSLEAEVARERRARPITAPEGRAVLVHVTTKGMAHEADDSLDELERLADTAGVEVVARVVQVRDKPDPRYLLGRGKLEDVVVEAMAQDAELLIFDQELKPNQARAIADLTDLKVVDRTQLILDIFAQRAHTRDGKLQVELAQLKYRLPRLGKIDDGLSRLTGGIGGRGPGETKLEIGRRRTRERISHLDHGIKQLAKRRRQTRERRLRAGVPVVAIVGYTNAGKSTLMNSLTRADAFVEDRLFATLDPLSRQLRLPSGAQVVLTDTVGFIRDLPQDLVTAFRATLEELGEASLLLHLVDAADRNLDERIRAVENILVDLEFHAIPRRLVLNKIDLLSPAEAQGLAQQLGAIAVSAREPATLAPLVEAIDRHCTARVVPAGASPEATQPWEEREDLDDDVHWDDE